MDQKTPPNFDEIKENCEKASHCRDKLHPTQHPGCFSVSLPSDTSLHFKSKASRRRTSSPQLLNHIQVVLSGGVATWCSCYGSPSLRLLGTPLMSFQNSNLSAYSSQPTKRAGPDRSCKQKAKHIPPHLYSHKTGQATESGLSDVSCRLSRFWGPRGCRYLCTCLV